MRRNPRTKPGKRPSAGAEVAVEDAAGADEGVVAGVDEVVAGGEAGDSKMCQEG